MPTAKDFRRIVLGMDGAIEGAHMGHPDFRVGGRIFASLHHDLKTAMVKLRPDQQDQFVREHSAVFAPESGAWGRQGYTRVRLEAAGEETLGEAVTLAWQNAVAQPKAARGKSARSATPRRRSPKR